MVSKLSAEVLGTFWLVLGGCGSAVLAAAFPDVGIGLLGVSLAFGLTVVTGAYAFGPISGGHFNPAVSVGLWAGGRFPAQLLLPYIVAQVVGGILGAGVLYLIASGKADFSIAGGFASNGYGEHSPGGYSLTAALGRRSRDDLHVPDHHPRHDAPARARRVRRSGHRSRAHADSPDQHSGDEHVGESGAQHGDRRSSSAAGRCSSSGCSGSRRSSAAHWPASFTGRFWKVQSKNLQSPGAPASAWSADHDPFSGSSGRQLDSETIDGRACAHGKDAAGEASGSGDAHVNPSSCLLHEQRVHEVTGIAHST